MEWNGTASSCGEQLEARPSDPQSDHMADLGTTQLIPRARQGCTRSDLRNGAVAQVSGRLREQTNDLRGSNPDSRITRQHTPISLSSPHNARGLRERHIDQDASAHVTLNPSRCSVLPSPGSLAPHTNRFTKSAEAHVPGDTPEPIPYEAAIGNQSRGLHVRRRLDAGLGLVWRVGKAANLGYTLHMSTPAVAIHQGWSPYPGGARSKLQVATGRACTGAHTPITLHILEAWPRAQATACCKGRAKLRMRRPRSGSPPLPRRGSCRHGARDWCALYLAFPHRGPRRPQRLGARPDLAWGMMLRMPEHGRGEGPLPAARCASHSPISGSWCEGEHRRANV